MSELLRDPLLITFINRKSHEVVFFRKLVYLLVLWRASTSPATQTAFPEKEFAVPTLQTICRKDIRLAYFERTKVAYDVLDDFVRRGLASSRKTDSKTLYSITEAGSRRAAEILEDMRKAMEIDKLPEGVLVTPLFLPLEEYFETLAAIDAESALSSPNPGERLGGFYKRVLDAVEITREDVRLLVEWYSQPTKTYRAGQLLGRILKPVVGPIARWRKRKDREKALISYERALESDAQDAEAWYNRGCALADLRRNEEALASYNKALKINANHASAWFNRGIVLHELVRDKEALESYDEALKIDQSHFKAWVKKAIMLAEIGRNDEALACYEMAFRNRDLIDDHGKTAYRAWAVIPFKLGIAAMKAGDANGVRKASSIFKRVHEDAKRDSSDIYIDGLVRQLENSLTDAEEKQFFVTFRKMCYE